MTIKSLIITWVFYNEINGDLCYILSYYFKPSRNIDSDLNEIFHVLSAKIPACFIESMNVNSKNITRLSRFS